MFILTNDSAVFMKTKSGQEVFVLGKRGDDVCQVAIEMARAAEGIENDPGENAPMSESGVVEWAVGLPAWERKQEYVNKG